MRRAYDYLIVGGGVLGLSLSRALKLKDPSARIALIEKERQVGLHASGRSGGVLHAGFYHASDDFKINLTKRGNELMTKYCLENKLPFKKCGQLVVATNTKDIEGLKTLKKRADHCQIETKWLDEKQTREIDPGAKTFESSLFCPSVANFDPKITLEFLGEEVRQQGVDIKYFTKYIGKTTEGIMTNKGEIKFNKLFNTAGIYADRIAHDFGFGLEYKIIPFKISFIKSYEPTKQVRTNIFGIPDFNFPYLEVKISLTPEGILKIGPAATPALWRESHLGLSKINLEEFSRTMLDDLKLLLFYNGKMNYVKLAITEFRKRVKSCLLKDANMLVNMPFKERFKWDDPGIIANLFDTKRKEYYEDLLVFSDKRSCHVLNLIFPGYTSSMSTAELIANKYCA